MANGGHGERLRRSTARAPTALTARSPGPSRASLSPRGGYTLRLAPTELAPGEARELRFRIEDADGARRDASSTAARAPHAPDRRPPRRHRLPAPAPGDGRGRDLERAGRRCRAPASTASSPTSRSAASRAPSATDLFVAGARSSPAAAGARRDGRRVDGYEVRLAGERRPRGRATPSCASPSAATATPVDARGLPRRQGPPGRAARGRPRLPPRPPARRRPAPDVIPFDGDLPDRRPLPPLPPVQARRRGADRRRSRRRCRDEPAATARERLELPIEGMTCASCANRVEKRLNELDGVEATVNFATERATRQLRPGAGRARAAGRGGRGAGYAAALPAAGRGEPRRAATTADADARRPAPAPDLRRGALAAGAAARDDPSRCSSTTGSGWRCSSRRRSCSGAAGPSTRRPGRTCATAPRRWTR